MAPIYIHRIVTISEVQTDKALKRFYGGKDPRDLPRYTYPEAARATGVPATTIHAWVRGQAYRRKHDEGYFEPVIRSPDGDGRLSFFNLIEVHILRSLRMNAEPPVRLQTVRKAMTIAERHYGIKRLLMHEELRHGAGELFLDRLVELESLSPSRQLGMRAMLVDYLKRVTFAKKLPIDFFPIERLTGNAGRKLILVSPLISFGRAVVARTGISTRAIVDRLMVGESEESVIRDYGLQKAELEEALVYEAA